MAKPEKKEEETSLTTKVVGAGIGGAIGGSIAGPVGGAVGAVSGVAITYSLDKTMKEFAKRALGKQEEKRVDNVLRFTKEKIQENIRNGLRVRDDGFFGDDVNDRSPADEIYEAVLLAGQREHEERKLKFYGNLFANLAFEPGIDKGHANLLIRTAKSLSYRQLCLLAIFARHDKSGLRIEKYGKIAREDVQIETKTGAVLHETFDLYSKALINCSGDSVLSVPDIKPAKMRTQGTGTILFKLMELNTIDPKGLEEVEAYLR